MTYIELFDEMAIKNICSVLVKKPDKVVFVGSQRKRMERAIATYNELFDGEIIFEHKIAKSNSLDDIVSVISSIVESEDECAFDCTGGDDLFLVALGVVFDKYKDKNIQVHRFNINTGKYYDCDGDGKTVFDIEQVDGDLHPYMTMEQNAKIYGGVLKDTDTPADDEYIKHIDILWSVCKKDTVKWNVAVSALCDGIDDENAADYNPLLYSFEFKNDGVLGYFKSVIEDLIKAEMIKDFDYIEAFNLVNIEFANELARDCFTAAGKVLELKIFDIAKKVVFSNGYGFDDVQTSVELDWDGVIKDGSADNFNEIDVMMMHGMMPVFVSCKNGQVSTDELYKLNSVANKFGGDFAKKVLVCNELYNITYDGVKICTEDYKRMIRDRARDMKITLVECCNFADDKALIRALTNYTQPINFATKV